MNKTKSKSLRNRSLYSAIVLSLSLIITSNIQGDDIDPNHFYMIGVMDTMRYEGALHASELLSIAIEVLDSDEKNRIWMRIDITLGSLNYKNAKWVVSNIPKKMLSKIEFEDEIRHMDGVLRQRNGLHIQNQDPGTESSIQEVIKAYIEWRGWVINLEDLNDPAKDRK